MSDGRSSAGGAGTREGAGDRTAASREEAIPVNEAAGADEALLERVRQYDEKALLELYDRYQGSIYRYAFAMSGDPSLAADITQDVFLMMMDRRSLFGWLFSRFDPRKGTLEGYLLGVARKLTRKFTARQSRWLPIDLADGSDDSCDLGQEMESHFMVGRMRAIIALLPVKYREAIVLCYLQEKSYEQAAAILGCSMGTVASRLSRGRKLLLERLEAIAPERAPAPAMARQEMPS